MWLFNDGSVRGIEWRSKKRSSGALTLLQTGEIELRVVLYQLFVHICEHICSSVIVEVV